MARLYMVRSFVPLSTKAAPVPSVPRKAFMYNASVNASSLEVKSFARPLVVWTNPLIPHITSPCVNIKSWHHCRFHLLCHHFVHRHHYLGHNVCPFLYECHLGMLCPYPNTTTSL